MPAPLRSIGATAHRRRKQKSEKSGKALHKDQLAERRPKTRKAFLADQQEKTDWRLQVYKEAYEGEGDTRTDVEKFRPPTPAEKKKENWWKTELRKESLEFRLWKDYETGRLHHDKGNEQFDWHPQQAGKLDWDSSVKRLSFECVTNDTLEPVEVFWRGAGDQLLSNPVLLGRDRALLAHFDLMTGHEVCIVHKKFSYAGTTICKETVSPKESGKSSTYKVSEICNGTPFSGKGVPKIFGKEILASYTVDGNDKFDHFMKDKAKRELRGRFDQQGKTAPMIEGPGMLSLEYYKSLETNNPVRYNELHYNENPGAKRELDGDWKYVYRLDKWVPVKKDEYPWPIERRDREGTNFSEPGQIHIPDWHKKGRKIWTSPKTFINPWGSKPALASEEHSNSSEYVMAGISVLACLLSWIGLKKACMKKKRKATNFRNHARGLEEACMFT